MTDRESLTTNALRTYGCLMHTFGGVPPSFPNSPFAISSVPIGIEVEIPWRAYFPDLWEVYFKHGERKYEQIPASEQSELSMLCAQTECTLLPLLEETVSCGVARGKDKYCEFAFPPSYDMRVIACMVSILEQRGLCPFTGPYSLQVTLGDIKKNKSAYYALMFIELLYTSEERIKSGRSNRSWAMKGKSGIRTKGQSGLLFQSQEAIEFKLLEFPKSIDELYQLLLNVSRLASWLKAEQNGSRVNAWEHLKLHMAHLLDTHGLPNELWQNPAQDPNVWEKFAKELPNMRTYAKMLLATMDV